MTDRLPDTAVSDLTRLAEAATPGPWKAETGRYDDLHWGDCGPGAGVTLAETDQRSVGFFTAGFPEADAEYIAAANPSVVAALCRELLERRAAMARVEAVLDVAGIEGASDATVIQAVRSALRGPS